MLGVLEVNMLPMIHKTLMEKCHVCTKLEPPPKKKTAQFQILSDQTKTKETKKYVLV